jgi:hypothetical protein
VAACLINESRPLWLSQSTQTLTVILRGPPFRHCPRSWYLRSQGDPPFRFCSVVCQRKPARVTEGIASPYLAPTSTSDARRCRNLVDRCHRCHGPPRQRLASHHRHRCSCPHPSRPHQCRISRLKAHQRQSRRLNLLGARAARERTFIIFSASWRSGWRQELGRGSLPWPSDACGGHGLSSGFPTCRTCIGIVAGRSGAGPSGSGPEILMRSRCRHILTKAYPCLQLDTACSATQPDAV